MAVIAWFVTMSLAILTRHLRRDVLSASMTTYRRLEAVWVGRLVCAAPRACLACSILSAAVLPADSRECLEWEAMICP